MKVFKHELVAALKNLKTVIPKGQNLPGLHGILVDDGVLTASNTELTMQMTLAASKGERFIIPENAFALIENLPEGEITITEEDSRIRISTSKIKNQFPTYPADEFIYAKPLVSVNKTNVSGPELIKALRRVEFACASEGSKPVLCGVCIKRHSGSMDVVATDAHVLAWDQLKSDGDDMEIIVPQEAVKKLISMGIDDDIDLNHDEHHAIFHTDKYTIYTRLINGPYLDYKRPFTEQPVRTYADRKEMLAAVQRAKMCADKEFQNSPITLAFSRDGMSIQKVGGDVIYDEKMPTGMDVEEDITIGFDGTILASAVKAFDSDELTMSMTSPAHPMILGAETSEMKVLVLPVRR